MKKYCIYSDKEIDENKMSKEHIIPKKMGGQLDFGIKVNNKLNNELGNDVDEPFIKDLINQFAIKHYGFKGYSKKEPSAVLKNSELVSGEVADVFFTPKDVFYKIHGTDINNKTRNENAYTYLPNSLIKHETTIKLDNQVRFYSKFFLGAAYNLYGETFLKYGLHNELRTLMNSKNPIKLIETGKINIKYELGFPLRIPQSYDDDFMNIIVKGKFFTDYHIIWESYYANALCLGVSFWGHDEFHSAVFQIARDISKFSQNDLGDVYFKELKDERRFLKYRKRDVLNKIIEWNPQLQKFNT